MLKQTWAAFNLIKAEISLFSHIAKIISTLFMLFYLVFSISFERGIFVVNIILLAITLANFTVYLILRKRKSKGAKKAFKIVKHSYVISKLILNAIPLATILISVFTSPENILLADIIFLPLLLLLWLVQVSLEIVSLYVQSRFTLLVNSLQEDFDFIITPILKIKNFFSKKSEDEEIADSEEKNLAGVFSKIIKTGEKIKDLIKK